MQLLQLPRQLAVPPLSAQQKEELQNDAAWCRNQCIPLQKKLMVMQQEALKAVRLLQFAEALEKEETEMTEARQRWYDNQRYTAQARLDKYGRYQQLKLEVKIAALQTEAALYEAQLRTV